MHDSAAEVLGHEHDKVRAMVAAAAPRVAEEGDWPPEIDAASLAERVPTHEAPAAGFDAGIACALDMIPRDKQALAAELHAAYTPGAVMKLRHECRNLSPDSETTWWLAACSICHEHDIWPAEFRKQLHGFVALAADPDRRMDAARWELDRMKSLFEVDDGVPFVTHDGGMQGAYIAGYPIAVEYATGAKLYFIGTFEPSLGLEDFKWGTEIDREGRPRSGPVHGSHQFVKAADREELDRVLAFLREHWSLGR